MPYRADRKQDVVERPEAGPVAEMVRQFADPFAFVRELVQNSIDAGATAISVLIERAAGRVTTTVRDDGVGMDRATIEGPLLTLFNSSKEGDSSKIGKYGVGFVSVFAIDPEFVDVETFRDGECHRVRLFRDHRYELERLSPREESGTLVILHQSLDAERFDSHREKLLASLLRWCRYAAVPIEFTAVDLDRGFAPIVRRIDTPLSVPTPLYVQTSRDGEFIVVGPMAGASRFVAAGDLVGDSAFNSSTFAGFYNRGLTLFETNEALLPELANVRFRVESRHLRHTLSRDNVLRDKAFYRLLGQVRALVLGSLRRELISRLTRAARALAIAKEPYDEELVLSYLAFLEAALMPPLALSLDEIVLPLVGVLDGKRVASLKRLFKEEHLFYTTTIDDLGRALMSLGTPVVLAPHVGIVAALGTRAPVPGPRLPTQQWLLLQQLSESEVFPSDAPFCAAVMATLKVVGIRVDDVLLARPSLKMVMPAVFVDSSVSPVGHRTWLCPKAHADSGWIKKKPKGALLLDVNDMSVDLARTRAKDDVALAAHLFVRVLLLFRRDDDGKLSDKLLEAFAKEIA